MPRATAYLTFIHTTAFERTTAGWLDDESLNALEHFLIEQPEGGDLVQGTGGVRKVRVAVQGRGKRGGGRVIYLYRASRGRYT